ncbi:MAG: protein kinase [Synechococcales cyanobacterium CRU_2_2]|nr:protein kinase [Synechococcales cyanobacterium CRU_2_2]
MTICIIPNCNSEGNAEGDRFCRRCGAPLLLKGRYRPLRALGHGGFGRTFLAQDQDRPSQQLCVIKQLSSAASLEAKTLDLFYKEASHLEELGGHAQIPQLLAAFTQGSEHYLIQEYVEGEDLHQEVLRNGCFAEQQIWQVLEEVAHILNFIHQRQIIHRDIKPSNIMRRKADGKLVLIDFGVAKLLSQTALQRSATVIGSPEYMAPEQTRGHIVPASDLYSLGVTCLYLMTLKPPLSFYSPAEDSWFWRETLDKPVSDRLAETLDRLLYTPISKRFSSAKALSFHAATHKAPPPLRAQAPPTITLDRETEWGDYLTEVDYRSLKQLLSEQNWREADRVTWRCLAAAIGKPGNFVAIGDLSRIPCGDLEWVDVLWRKHSGDRFGFTIQAQIYAQVGQDYGRFCQQVGWRINAQGVHSLEFSLDSPRGHLPSAQWVSGGTWWTQQRRLAERLVSCRMLD